ncbi:taste receptor type 2 member 1-like [Alligator mississippiensis]|uniref:taste receptor type 2 member 1-like n=1 Tax=Alligator mississippiensis TaxID=8496 RepID=UPI002877EA2C|nr:taste receptor type 2 member 1-like [Alligator mississippiensis]
MSSLSAIIFIILYGVQFFVGIITNIFIVTVNVIDWTKDIKLSSNDQILVYLGLSNLFVQCTATAADFCFFFWTDLLYSGFSSQTFFFFVFFGSICASCFTGYLCTCYYVKITDSTYPLYLRMKMAFIKNLPWLLPWIIATSFGLSLAAVWDASKKVSLDMTANFSTNYTKPLLLFHYSTAFRIILLLLECIWPLIVTSFLVLKLIKTLCKHIRNMERTMAFGQPNLDAHKHATRTLTSLLILFISYNLLWSILVYDIFSYPSTGFLICITLLATLTSVQAITLILCNRRMKQKALRILQSIRQFSGG